MTWAELAGYTASLLVFATFCMKTLIPLRLVAIASNIAFIVYGLLAGLFPILFLHCALLPLNTWRTYQQILTLRHIRAAARENAEVSALIPFMKQSRFEKGAVLFRKGDDASNIYFLARGAVTIPEIGKTLDEGTLFGEIGPFTGQRVRTASAVCSEPSEIYVISEDDLVRLCQMDGAFGYFLTKLIASRLVENQDRLERELSALRSG
ncbi:MAG: cyclic nucleotide-binding domain-containing protein [Rhodobacteraceae bacterium]|nr:MAG: cyclic nucleotide-binding domain-containing protein [Paracoccaceae bacterium]